jgi:hypothetical protein
MFVLHLFWGSWEHFWFFYGFLLEGSGNYWVRLALAVGGLFDMVDNLAAQFGVYFLIDPTVIFGWFVPVLGWRELLLVVVGIFELLLCEFSLEEEVKGVD